MPIGVIVNVLSVVLGGLLGSVAGNLLPEKLKQDMTSVFGICALGMGISSIVLMRNMPAVVFSIIAGTLIGTALDIDGAIRRATAALLSRLNAGQGLDTRLMVTAMVLFCFSGTGVYGSLTSGMTGDHSILIAKSVLDFFTAMIFATQLKKAVALIGVPQLVVMLLLFFSARLILPLTNEVMIADFKACGGFILLATGLTIMSVKQIPVANMILSMVLVMPVSAFWTTVLMPLFSV